ncbi:MAG: hypothetical protein EOP51_14075 [Sphingobacteriales bacterium]|nr:MAG: hypothetical protein EOP51_14075 [Sphingobacteriales bacterium]
MMLVTVLVTGGLHLNNINQVIFDPTAVYVADYKKNFSREEHEKIKNIDEGSVDYNITLKPTLKLRNGARL